ncbi:YrzO family protein [Oceanobacillus luteolus]|uniref:YrzO family protein n=1 Tax=Oceanobacillus luteolus TaxID=1274358 RepID=A0ABW4HPX9_9BACI
MLIIVVLIGVMTLLSIDGNLRKGYKQQQEMLELLKEIKEKQ